MMLAASAARRIPSHAAPCRSRIFAATQSRLDASLLDANAAPSTHASSPYLLSSVRPLSSGDLPYHLVVGMPALSPTMESGVISSWSVGEGDSFIAGEALAEIETDKATIAFEAQDDGVVAKILKEAGPEEISVGVPILVTVEEEEDVAAFKDFVPEETAAAAAPAPAPAAAEPEPSPEAPVEAAAALVPAPAPAAPAPAPAAPAPAAPAPPPPAPEAPAIAAASSVEAPTIGPSWGNLAAVASPIAKTLSAEQRAYVEKYGSTGQIPL